MAEKLKHTLAVPSDPELSPCTRGCAACKEEEENASVNHPKHYNSHPSGIECIQVAEHMGFNLGNAIKYIWREDQKNGIEDLRKAIWYIQREIAKREKK